MDEPMDQRVMACCRIAFNGNHQTRIGILFLQKNRVQWPGQRNVLLPCPVFAAWADRLMNCWLDSLMVGADRLMAVAG